MRFFALLLPFILLFTAGCGEETAAPRDPAADFAYFPLQLNQPKFFRLDSVLIRNTVGGVVYDTVRVEVRETLVERFTDATGAEAYRGERYDRRAASDPWRFVQTYVVERNQTAAVRTEDNLRFTKLAFPIRPGRRWDGNAAFDDRRSFPVGGDLFEVYRDWDYRYRATDEAVVLPTGVDLAETILVQQAEQTDIVIEYRVAYERYAPGLGLVERFVDVRGSQCRTCCNLDFERCGSLPWNERAELGYIIHQVLLP